LIIMGAGTPSASGAATPQKATAGATPKAASRAAAATVVAATGATASGATEYVVLYKAGQSSASARAAITRAGGTLVRENAALGSALVRSTDPNFAAAVNASAVLDGAARNRVIGKAPGASQRSRDVEQLTKERAASRGQGSSGPSAASRRSAANTVAPAPEPLADRQWDMRQIGATANGSYATNQGNKGVLVGIIDTGIDGSHPDIAPNFNAGLSANFVTDNPTIDGPCEVPSCVDPVDEDDDGHGTHVASTIGSPINGLGMAGVAPNVTLVNVRAGQDSGFFFLQPTLDALTYAGQIGVDVVNMSFFTDPWLFNCLNNPADSPAEQTEQRVIREATQRALNFAVRHGVLPVAAEGNEATDLGHPTVDDTSPDFPPDTAKHRDVGNTCITVPTESRGVVGVSATGPTTRKSYFSNYGLEQTDVAAPGGDFYDSPDNTGDPRNIVLAAYPTRLAMLNGDLNPDGTPNNPFVVQSCAGATCAYYQYLQGTSMAAPHAVGVAALIVSRFGRPDRQNGGLGLNPRVTQHVLFDTAVPHACPSPRLFEYTRIRADGTVGHEQATCEGPISKNGFYGPGIVNAFSAVSDPRH
jgi:lantibiotic leader peptide-processing serine protease